MSIEALISVFSMYQWYLWHTFGTMHRHTFYANIPHSSGSKSMRDGRFHKPSLFKVLSANPAQSEVYSIQHYVIKFVSDLR